MVLTRSYVPIIWGCKLKDYTYGAGGLKLGSRRYFQWVSRCVIDLFILPHIDPTGSGRQQGFRIVLLANSYSRPALSANSCSVILHAFPQIQSPTSVTRSNPRATMSSCEPSPSSSPQIRRKDDETKGMDKGKNIYKRQRKYCILRAGPAQPPLPLCSDPSHRVAALPLANPPTPPPRGSEPPATRPLPPEGLLGLRARLRRAVWWLALAGVSTGTPSRHSS